MIGLTEKTTHPISIPSLIGTAAIVRFDEKLPLVLLFVILTFLSCFSVSFNVVCATVHTKLLPAPAQLNMADVYNRADSDVGGFVNPALKYSIQHYCILQVMILHMHHA